MKPNRLICFLSALVLFILLACNALDQSAPIQTPTTSIYATEVSVGVAHACALLNTGHIVCWGSNDSNQFGDGSFMDHNVATEIIGLTDINAISAGGQHTCAITKSGNVKCWGGNESGQLGNGTKKLSMEIVEIPDLVNVSFISAGWEHTCAILEDGSAKCWGKNLTGQLGNDTFTRIIPSPANVVDLGASISSISAGNEHTCALTSDGNVKCWGRNVSGELGTGQETNRSNTPVDVIGLNERVISVSTSYAKTCAVTGDGKVRCWGWIGDQQFSNVPVDLGKPGESARIVATGANHICALDDSGKVYCLGENSDGQLGNGSTSSSHRFVQVKGLQSVVTSISASYDYTCALTTNGEVWCWGNNSVGQLGNGTTNNSSIPVKVIGINQ
ncbi:MAG: RCC1 domain-containing protein [Chloroflexota bacterium]